MMTSLLLACPAATRLFVLALVGACAVGWVDVPFEGAIGSSYARDTAQLPRADFISADAVHYILSVVFVVCYSRVGVSAFIMFTDTIPQARDPFIRSFLSVARRADRLASMTSLSRVRASPGHSTPALFGDGRWARFAHVSKLR